MQSYVRYLLDNLINLFAFYGPEQEKFGMVQNERKQTVLWNCDNIVVDGGTKYDKQKRNSRHDSGMKNILTSELKLATDKAIKSASSRSYRYLLPQLAHFPSLERNLDLKQVTIVEVQGLAHRECLCVYRSRSRRKSSPAKNVFIASSVQSTLAQGEP
ncbi:hypothetical protein BC943DRAFT_352897 [Umbelopsis sp. AD052]|nr:hypothetical protein BC943DRAFT_352897 [Umbelopsis sp. AD052]